MLEVQSPDAPLELPKALKVAQEVVKKDDEAKAADMKQKSVTTSSSEVALKVEAAIDSTNSPISAAKTPVSSSAAALSAVSLDGPRLVEEDLSKEPEWATKLSWRSQEIGFWQRSALMAAQMTRTLESVLEWGMGMNLPDVSRERVRAISFYNLPTIGDFAEFGYSLMYERNKDEPEELKRLSKKMYEFLGKYAEVGFTGILAMRDSEASKNSENVA